MPHSTRIPPLLQPCVRLPREDALLLVTSTLGASANWLLVRYLCDALSTSNAADGGHGEEESHNVVLVSWMREYEFWKHEARKGAGLDLERLRKEGRFAFVDGLSGLCLEDGEEQQHGADDSLRASSARASTTLPNRGLPEVRTIPARGPRIPAAPTVDRTPVMNTLVDMASPSKATTTRTGLHTLKSFDLIHLHTTITAAISHLTSTSPTQRKTFVVLDNPDLLLALDSTIAPSAMTSLLLTLHTLSTVSHVLTHIQADTPLLSLSTPPQLLEVEHHNFLVKLAHMSTRVVSVRILDTGVARDVSGVLRCTEQRTGWLNLGLESGDKGPEDETGRGKEVLYQVKGDGSVKVFERGAGGET